MIFLYVLPYWILIPFVLALLFGRERHLSYLINVQPVQDNFQFLRPYLALISIISKINKKKTDNFEWIFNKVTEAYSKEEKPKFDDVIGYIGSLSEWSIFKRRPQGNNVSEAEFVNLLHKDGESHMGLQFILTGVLSVFYDETRRNLRRPGFTAFPSGRNHDKSLGKIECDGER